MCTVQNQNEQHTFMTPILAPIDPAFYMHDPSLTGAISMVPASSNGSVQSLQPLSPLYQPPGLFQPRIQVFPPVYSMQPLPPSPIHPVSAPLQQVSQPLHELHPVMVQPTPSPSPNSAPIPVMMQPTPSPSPNSAPMTVFMYPPPLPTNGCVTRSSSPFSEFENSVSSLSNNNLLSVPVPGMGQHYHSFSRSPESTSQFVFADPNADESYRERPMSSESGYQDDAYLNEDSPQEFKRGPAKAQTYNRGPAKSQSYSDFSEGEEQERKGKAQKKFAYRSKQKKINKTYKKISETFSDPDPEKNKFAAERELVRGDDCLRVHVKTFLGLNEIDEALTEVPKRFTLKRIAAVYSKKNQFQYKGLIVYMRLGSVEEREACEEFLRGFENLKQIAPAKKKEATAPSQKQNSDVESIDANNRVEPDLDGLPKPVARTGS